MDCRVSFAPIWVVSLMTESEYHGLVQIKEMKQKEKIITFCLDEKLCQVSLRVNFTCK